MDSDPSHIDLSQIPLSQPPPGQVTNFVNPVSIAWAGRLAIWLTLPIMVIGFCLRAYVRLQKHQVGPDDYLLTLGAAGAASFSSVLIPIFLNNVWGRHAWDIPVSSLVPWYFEYSVTAGCLYNISAMFTKVSILALYLRIFSPSRRARLFIWIGIIFTCLGYLALTVCMLAYLVPRRGDGGWGSTANLERMGDPARILDFAQGIFSVVTDAYVMAIPPTIVIRLNMPVNRKVGLLCIFLVGSISLGCCIAGAVLRYHALVFTVEDNRWLSVKFQALCVTELNIGIFCACVPVFFVVLRTWMEKTESGLIYLRQRLTSRSSKGTDMDGVCESEATKEGSRHPEVGLVIPNGTLTGVKSFFQKAGRTQTQRTEEQESTIHVLQDFELRSMDCDYHAQIRQGSPHESSKSLIANKTKW